MKLINNQDTQLIGEIKEVLNHIAKILDLDVKNLIVSSKP